MDHLKQKTGKRSSRMSYIFHGNDDQTKGRMRKKRRKSTIHSSVKKSNPSYLEYIEKSTEIHDEGRITSIPLQTPAEMLFGPRLNNYTPAVRCCNEKGRLSQIRSSEDHIDESSDDSSEDEDISTEKLPRFLDQHARLQAHLIETVESDDSSISGSESGSNITSDEELYLSEDCEEEFVQSKDDNTDEMEFPSMDVPLHPSLSVTKIEIMYILMNIFMRHNLTNAALCDILQLVNLIVGFKSIPETYKSFSGFFSRHTYARHYVCNKCGYYIGLSKTICENCGSENNMFFVVFDFISNLKDILSNNWNSIVDYKAKMQKVTNVADIVNAGVLKGKNLCNAITLTINTDGVKIFNSNVKRSLWPIIFCVNELPPQLRYMRKNVLIAGLWLGNGEPDLDVFLKPFGDLLKNIYEEGLRIGSHVIDTVQVIACCVDTKARCKIQNFKQFNGYEGCSFCLYPGDISGRQIRYGYKPNVPLRNAEDTLRAMAISSTTGIPVNGVKGVSPLIRIPDFDVVRNCPVDYMHGILLGVCRQMCRIWFECPSSPSYIKDKLNYIDKMLESISPFTEASRSARKISDRNNWKANEWLNWCIHYSPICLYFTLPAEYYKHHMLLVSSVINLLQGSISAAVFSQCDKRLRKFVKNFERLYGINEMTYNVHLLLHLVDCAKDYGPLWAFSLFIFEDVNGLLKKFVKGPKEPIIQIANRCVMAHSRFNTNVHFLQPKVYDFYQRLNSFQSLGTKTEDEKFDLPDTIINKYSDNRHFEVICRLKYKRFLYKAVTVSTSDIRHHRKPHNNCYFSAKDDDDLIYGEIQQVISDDSGIYFVFKAIEIEKLGGCVYKATIDDDCMYMIKVDDTVSKYIKITYNDEIYLCKLEYILHVD